MIYPTKLDEEYIVQNLVWQNQMGRGEKLPFLADGTSYRQMSLFEMPAFDNDNDKISQYKTLQTSVG